MKNPNPSDAHTCPSLFHTHTSSHTPRHTRSHDSLCFSLILPIFTLGYQCLSFQVSLFLTLSFYLLPIVFFSFLRFYLSVSNLLLTLSHLYPSVCLSHTQTCFLAESNNTLPFSLTLTHTNFCLLSVANVIKPIRV